MTEDYGTDQPEDEPTVANAREAIEVLQEVAGGLNDGHARYPVPELYAVIDWLRSQEVQR